MTLNLPHQPPQQGNYSLPMRFDDYFFMDGVYDFGGDKFEKAHSHECAAAAAATDGSDDVLDLLPPDPFGMNMDATLTTITSFIWNKSTNFPMWYDMCFREEQSVDHPSSSSSSAGEPHEAFNYVVGYLGLKELLTVECVCKSLHSAVTGDPSLWRKLSIESEKIDDDALFKITSRAKGNLQDLSLFKCLRVTNDGLERVLRSNRRIEKLSIPGCSRLSVDLILKSLKELQDSGAFGLKCIKMGGRYDVTLEHFEKLKELLHVENFEQTKTFKPRIYRGRLSPVHHNEDDDTIIDIERCPRCENIRLVFDCPLDKCHMLESSVDKCRACIICIMRCCECGRCLNDGGYIETFSFENLCLYCLKQ